MPHSPKPFFKKARGCWHVEIDRRQHNLGPDRDAAFDRYHALMRNRPQRVDCTLVVGVLDSFLDWLKGDASARTFEWYRRHLRHLARALPQTIAELQPKHVTEALARHPGWGPTTRHGFCRAAQRAFRRAEEEGHVLKSPLRKIRKPRPQRRERIVSSEEFAALLAAAPGEEFRDLLVAAWETGARPQDSSPSRPGTWT